MTDGIRRYPQSHVAEALAQVQRGGRIEPHSAIVLTAEVRALEKQLAELRAASAALVEHLERRADVEILAFWPSKAERKFNGELGALASHVFNVLERVKP